MRASPSDHSLVQGIATPAGATRFRDRYAARYQSGFYRQLPAGLEASSLGLGTYLGDCDDSTDARYAATVRAALGLGVNLIDSAINYRCQRSERAVGRGLRDALSDGSVRRDEVVLCTKGGYIPLDGAPPASREAYQQHLQQEYFAPGLMTPDDVIAGGHCLAPQYLENQIARSRHNLGVETIDIYYLHNPAQQLDTVSRDRFNTTIHAAFALLEQQAKAGTIAMYGCATWNDLRVPPDAPGHLSLEDLVAIARDVGGEHHHFRVVQLPINLAMPEAVRAPTQRLGSSVVPLLEAAAELGIRVVASATLMQSQLAQGLPDRMRELFPDCETDAQRAIAFVRSLPVASALVGMQRVEHLSENLARA